MEYLKMIVRFLVIVFFSPALIFLAFLVGFWLLLKWAFYDEQTCRRLGWS